MHDEDLTPGRKRQVPKGGYKLIANLAEQDAPDSAIAEALSVSPATWSRIRQRDPKAEAAYQGGRAKLYNNLLSVILKPQLTDGASVNERIALMKARHLGALAMLNNRFWKEGAANEEGRVVLEVRIPKALTREAYRARLTQQKEGSDDGQD